MMIDESQHHTYSDDWRRTNPDLAFFLPPAPPAWQESVDHVLVSLTREGALLAIWTYCTQEHAADESIMVRRSEDGGRTWTGPDVLAGPGRYPGQVASFGFPVMSRGGRIYCFYNRSTALGDSYTNSFLECKVSDDDGRTWVDGNVRIPFRHTRFDLPDPKAGASCIVWQKPIRDRNNKHLVGITRWTSERVVRRTPVTARAPRGVGDCHVEFLRFENIDDEPDPRDLELTWLPDSDDLVSVPVMFDTEFTAGFSFAQEPGVVLLPDGRLFASMRTPNGQIWYAVSADDGHSWRPSEMLRFRDGGAPMENPVSPTPLYRLHDGRFIQLLQNHDGWGYNGLGPLNSDSRRPQFLSVGEFRPDAHQPIWFSEPLLLFDTDGIGVAPHYRPWLSMYSSLTEREGERILWYSDRKLFGVGRYITDEMLAPLTVPEG